MYIETVPNRNSPPAILLREGWREGGKVRKRTLANLSRWPKAKIDMLRRLLKDEPLVGRDEAFDIVRSLPHGHVAAVLGTIRKLGLDRLIDPKPSARRNQVLAMMAARILEPSSKLATARGLAEATAVSTLGEMVDAELCLARHSRHTVASQAVANGVPLPTVARMLGHAQPIMTLRYAHVGDHEVQGAADRVGAIIADTMAIFGHRREHEAASGLQR